MVAESVVFIKLAAVCPQCGVTRAQHLYIWDFLNLYSIYVGGKIQNERIKYVDFFILQPVMVGLFELLFPFGGTKVLLMGNFCFIVNKLYKLPP